MKTFSTAQAAKMAGVTRQTLHMWITEGLVDAPEPVMIGKSVFRFWTEKDVARLKKFKGTLKRGPKKGVKR